MTDEIIQPPPPESPAAIQEYGWWHVSIGYWQTLSYPPPEILAAYPEGTIEVPLRPGEFWEWDPVAGAWVDNTPPPPTPEELRALMPALARSVFRLKFKNAGMNTAFINGVIGAIEDPDEQEEMQIIWDDQQQFARLDPFVLMVAAAKPKTPEEIDVIWMAP